MKKQSTHSDKLSVNDAYATTIRITKSKRKTVSITCNPDHSISIAAPFYLSDRKIHLLIKEKSSWINKHLKKFHTNKHWIFPKEILSGNHLLYLGHLYTISCVEHDIPSIQLQDSLVIVSTPASFTNDQKTTLILEWYKERAKDIFTDLLSYFEDLLNCQSKALKIKQVSSRWGSCSSNKTIHLNWILIKAPIEVISYVILHECCHLFHMNHSSAFWNLVATYMPDYKTHQLWLKENGVLLLAHH